MPYALLAKDGRLFAGLADGQLWQSFDKVTIGPAARSEGDELGGLVALSA